MSNERSSGFAIFSFFLCVLAFSHPPALASDPGIRRSRLIRRFSVVNSGALDIGCPLGTILQADDIFTLCMEDYKAGNLTGNKLYYTDKIIEASKGFCKTATKDGSCIINVNKKEASADRFIAGGKDCKGGVVFLGLYYCIDQNPSPVRPGERATLIDNESKSLQLRCEAGKKIKVVNAEGLGNVLCDNGFHINILGNVSAECDGKPSCDYNSNKENGPCPGSKRYHAVTYVCE